MKKTLALLLALAMVFSTVTVAFAEEAISADAQACETLGMLQGSGTGVTAEYLATAPSRLQAAIMFLRLKGLEDEALAYTGEENFADVDQVAWAGGKAILGYLKANPELGWIGDGVNFDPSKALTAQQYYKVMLEALGYKQNTAEVIGDFVYGETLTFAASKGLTKVAAVTSFTVNDIAIATMEALKAEVKASEKTLAYSLVEAGVITETAAVAAGVYTVPEVVLAVESVKADNLKEVYVAFNKAVDEETVEEVDYYSIEGKTILSAELQADGKTVKLVVDNATLLDNSTEHTLVITDDIVEASVDFTVVDATLPVAQSIELTGPNTFEITFSEPINSDSEVTVEVEDGIYSAVPALDDTNVVSVELGASTLNEGEYDVVVTGAEDFAGHPALKKTFVLNYVKDTTAPVPTLVSADQTEVVIDFGKEVTDEDGLALGVSYFYHSYSSYVPNNISWDGSEATLTFEDYPLPEGTVKIVVDYDANDNVITDLWGNEMTANTVLTAAIEADNTKPVVTKVEVVDEKTVEVYFSEGLGDGNEAYTDDENIGADFFVVKQDGEEIDQTITSAKYDVDDIKVTLTFDGEDLDGAYTIDIADISDDAYVANTMTDVTVAFEVKDITGINLEAIEVEAVDGDSYDTLIVRFPDEMSSTVLNKANYLVSFDGEDFEELADADTVAFFNGNDTVKITIADEDAYDIETVVVELMVARLTDSVGNVSPLLSATILATTADAPAIAADGVVMTSYKTVEVTFDSVIVSAPANGFLISKNGGTAATAAAVSLAKNDDGVTVATLTLRSAQQLASDATSFASGDTITVSIAEDLVKADTGKYADDEAAANVDVVAVDAMNPVFDSITATGDVITVVFSEDLETTAYAAFDIVVKDAEGEELIAMSDYTATIIDGNLVVDINVTGVTDVTGYTVASKATVNYLMDAADNMVTVFTAQEVEE